MDAIMSAEQFRVAQRALKLNNAELAAWLGYKSRSAVSKMRGGRSPIPGAVARAIRARIAIQQLLVVGRLTPSIAKGLRDAIN